MARVPDADPKFRETGDEAEIPGLLAMLEATNVNMFKALANSPHAFRGFCELAVHAFFGSFDRRTRESLILRVAALVGSEYEWCGHAAPARAAGLSEDAIRGLRDGTLVGLSEAESAAVRYAEAVETRTVDDELWASARQHFDDRQMVELTLLAGFYGLAARTMMALDVEVDERFEDAVLAGTELHG